MTAWLCVYAILTWIYMLYPWYWALFIRKYTKQMEQILLTYSLPKETVEAIMMLYKNTKVKVRSPDGDTDYFGIVAGVLQGDTLTPYWFIICLDYVLRTSIDLIKENGFTLEKKEAEDTPHKLLWMWTAPMTLCFRQIHPPKSNPCYIVWNG